MDLNAKVDVNCGQKDGWMDGLQQVSYEWTFVGYFLCSKYPTITPKVPNNQLRNKGHLLFLLLRSTQLVSSGLLGLTDGQMDGRTENQTHISHLA